ncbi:unnamed protein product [Amoebophrya sp. A120]|nr:unnamed protein product [Amoebophrya sp. A120]|eukprot:GSA120T00022989001.1
MPLVAPEAEHEKEILRLQSFLQRELESAEQGIEVRVQEINKRIQEARNEVRDHCDRVETALEKRRYLLLQEVDRLELSRVRLLEKQQKQLRKIRRCIEEEPGEDEKIEKYLRGFDLSSARTKSSSAEREQAGGSSSSTSSAKGTSKHWLDAFRSWVYYALPSSSRPSASDASELHQAATRTSSWASYMNLFPPYSTARTDAGAASKGDLLDGLFPVALPESASAEQQKRYQLLLDLKSRVITEPVADTEIFLDLREPQLVPLLERLGAVSSFPITYQPPFLIPGVGAELLPEYTAKTRSGATKLTKEDSEIVRPALPKQAKQVLTLSAGCLAGITSATATHWLDVAKVLRQVGARAPNTLSTYVLGLPMGAIAQGQRFGLTLLIDQNIQREVKKRTDSQVLKFAGSMVAAGTGEFLAMPPVVVKNFQIAHQERSFIAASKHLYRLDGMRAFFKGVFAGVVRKSLANAIVLQSIGPTKFLLAPMFATTSSGPATAVAKNKDMAAGGGTSSSTTTTSAGAAGASPAQQPGAPSTSSSSLLQKMGIGFMAGSITGSIAEVATNYPDRVKTLMHTKPRISLYNAALEAARDPFRGALWAGLRKGMIRGINWGTVGVWTAVLEDCYWRYYNRSESF